jgi:hypothetical protein
LLLFFEDGGKKNPCDTSTRATTSFGRLRMTTVFDFRDLHGINWDATTF